MWKGILTSVLEKVLERGHLLTAAQTMNWYNLRLNQNLMLRLCFDEASLPPKAYPKKIISEVKKKNVCSRIVLVTLFMGPTVTEG